LAQFFSDVFVGVLIAGFVSWVLAKSKKYSAYISADAEYKDDSPLCLSFSVVNDGKEIFKTDEIYWHVFIEGLVSIDSVSGNNVQPDQLEVMIDNRLFHHFRALLNMPSFPGRPAELFNITIRPLC
jgi:hypothetical protein